MRYTAFFAGTLAAVLALAAWAGPGAGSGMVRGCSQTRDLKLNVGSCTAMIDSGKYSGKDLAKLYNNRGNRYLWLYG